MPLLVATGCALRLPPQSADIHIPEATEPAPEQEEPAVHLEICVNESTRARTPYKLCDSHEKGHTYYYVPMTAKIPAVGEKARSGTWKTPDYVAGRATAKGGEASKAVFTDERDRVEICVRERTRVRVPDERCEDDDRGVEWYYLLLSRRVPAMGDRSTDGSFHVPELSETYRARTRGGEASKVAIRQEDTTDQNDSGTTYRYDTDDGTRSTTRQRHTTRIGKKSR